MPTANENFTSRPNVRGRLVLDLLSQNIGANQSTMRVRLYCEETSSQPSWHLTNDLPFSVSGFGSTISGNWSFDFRPSGNQSFLIVNTTRTFTHNADGTLTRSLTSSISGDILGSCSPSLNYTVPRIPRGPKLKHEGEYKNTISFIKIDGAYEIAIPNIKAEGEYAIGGG